MDLKLDKVAFPSFSMVGLYLVASGLKLGLIKESSEVLLLMEHLGLDGNLLVELMLGLYFISQSLL